jgi:hypothetical protein
MKSLIDLQISVLEESGTQCGVSTSKDVKTILTRVKHEGESFLMITLPQFTKDLQRALANEKVDSTLFKGFPLKGKIPAFLSGFLSRVFDEGTGDLLHKPDVDCIRAVLQVTGMLAKVEIQCAQKRIDSAFAKYVQIEGEIRETDLRLRGEDLNMRNLRTWTHLLFGDLLHIWQNQVIKEEIIPTHGPGAVADKFVGNDKWMQPAWPDRLEDVFPFGRYAYSSWSLFLDDIDAGLRVPQSGTEKPVKVITVPKTLKTPRIIAVEPVYMQYMQQGLRRAFEKAVKVSNFGSLIDYSSQIPNQEMALQGSLQGSLATLDLSDASDRVSNQLVRYLLHDFPVLLGAIDATRSRSADVLGHGVIRLAKFASMGSALCFPIESLVFATISMMACYEEFKGDLEPGSPYHRRNFIMKYIGSVRTYGDDIIVPTRFARAVADKLESYGMKVNHAKSFWTGRFRESCGKEYFQGEDVTYIKAKAVLPSRQQHEAERVISIVKTSALRNHLFEYGYWRTCQKLDQLLEGFIPYPAVGPDSPAIGRLSSLGYETQRENRDLFLPLIRGVKVHAKPPISQLDGSGALMKYFAMDSELPNPDSEHLFRAGRPPRLYIKEGWLRAY